MNKKEARQFLKDQAGKVRSAFLDLTLEELEVLKNVAENYSTTNCWFVEYMMKSAFLDMINDRIIMLTPIIKP